MVVACQQQEQDLGVGNDQGPALNLPAVPTPQPPLDRAALLAAVAEAASAFAAGAPIPEELGSLDGREFQLRIRFGCGGPSPDLGSEALGWAYNADRRRLRIRAKPTISAADPLVAALAGDESESVEGFWIPRPWLLQAVCPKGAAVRAGDDEATDETESAVTETRPEERSSAEPTPAAPRIGIAQFFTSSDARTRRRDSRPYEVVETLAEGSAIPAQGFDLVLSGRLRAMPGKGVVACSAPGPDSPPECLISAEFQRVRIEDPSSGEVHGEWGGG